MNEFRANRLQDHPWVTCRGADPLLSKEENCAELIDLPTQEELNTAITGNMKHLVAVVSLQGRL